EILAYTALAANEHGGVRPRHFLDDASDGPHLGAVVERVRVALRLVTGVKIQGSKQLQANPPVLRCPEAKRWRMPSPRPSVQRRYQMMAGACNSARCQDKYETPTGRPVVRKTISILPDQPPRRVYLLGIPNEFARGRHFDQILATWPPIYSRTRASGQAVVL